MSSPAEDSETQEHHKSSWWTRALTAIVVLVAGAAIVLALIPRHLYAITPGSAQPVAPMIKVPGHPAGGISDGLYMVDVSVVPVDNLLEELYWRAQPHVELDSRQAVSGNYSNAQYIQLNEQMMQDSIQTAEVVALQMAGYRLRWQNGPRVMDIVPKSPAAAKLKVGDIVKAVNGHPTQTIQDVSKQIRSHKPGSTVQLQIVRGGRNMRLAVGTMATTQVTGGQRQRVTLVGIEAENRIKLPIRIQITPGNIGGPSAGLMFTLGLVQRLEHRDITHGCAVAGTGEIAADHSVQPIGGVTQKVIAAEQRGAKYFLVPDTPDNLKPALAAAHSIKVVPVKTADQALAYLNHLKPCK